ncbi:protein-L-isoaspartate O-methyltransferase family protein [Corynebacterium cystitidis]|uniref:Protein-L-isoaspartate O-methyltransferase n=1 Tax=Corynebacterium cystitidis DSM 20524 TaxID=1121357 RepID=A0A1H9T9X6_9CORY|nr:protein-L-isoaspartate O-methyltransferase [Corynebacterium cystitidis]WJY83514.1 Protein-L-isoaspartate O-methyltransferase [Corynebacterium cystitidis DSM 20524]SER93847.1 protein-L-isoaspartate(D-aspartate) O-methyltransferase [Corynebacterium cystitidis DSM 20524]SNV92375.1 protein-L-isoaspartate(D-aspartate)O-methyltransferase [Corynebacterium cystitidis]
MERISEAMKAVERSGFLPPNARQHAHRDQPLSIGYQQTNSQPTTVRIMLELLDPQPGEKILDVGSGSGWTTALLAHLVGPDGQVEGVEIVEELVAFGQANVQAPNARIRQAGNVLGVPEEAPFDKILVSAEAKRIPQELVDQLAPGGVMVLPVGNTMMRVVKHSDGEISTSQHGGFIFVPLIHD